MPTGIEWCDETWNPGPIGCTGCELGDKCWALRDAWRLSHNPKMGANQEKYARVVTDECVWCEGRGHVHAGAPEYSEEELKDNAPCPKCNTTGRGPLRWTGEFSYFPERLDQPLRLRQPRRIAVCLMGDMFAEGVEDQEIWKVYKAMSRAPWHTFIILTKRPERMAELVPRIRGTLPDRLEHIIHGTSISDQRTADLRVPELLKVPGRHCLSIEPMYSAVNFLPWLLPLEVDGKGMIQGPKTSIEEIYLGGQNGPGWKDHYMEPEWARDVLRQCRAAGVRFIMKKMGGGKEPPSDLMVRELPNT